MNRDKGGTMSDATDHLRRLYLLANEITSLTPVQLRSRIKKSKLGIALELSGLSTVEHLVGIDNAIKKKPE